MKYKFLISFIEEDCLTCELNNGENRLNCEVWNEIIHCLEEAKNNSNIKSFKLIF